MFQSAKLGFLTVLSLGLLALGRVGSTAEPIPLHVAVETGLVEVEVQGRGAAAGDSIQVGVKRKKGVDVSVSVAPGTVITPKVGLVQSMVLGGVKSKWAGHAGWQKADVIELKDNEKHVFIVEGYCRDIEKKIPSDKDSFSVTGPNAGEAELLIKAKQLGATIRVTQSALWIQRSGLTDEEIQKKSKLTAEEISAGRQLLISIKTPNPALDLQIKTTMDGLRKLAALIPAPGVRRGDIVEFTSDEVEVKARRGNKTLGKLKKGQSLEVVAVNHDGVVIRAEFNGRQEKGVVKLTDVKVVRPAGQPFLGAVLNAVNAVQGGLQLEVFDMPDDDSGE